MSNKNINLNIHHSEHQDFAIDIFKHYIGENYSFGMSNIEITDLDKFIKKLKVDSEAISEFKSIGGKKYIIETEEFLYTIYSYSEKNAFLDVFTKTRKILDNQYKIISKFISSDKEFIISRSSFYISNHLNVKEDFFKLKDFEDIIPEYFPDIDVDEFFNQYLKSDEPLFVLSGKAGTGKSKFLTYMLKYLLKNPEQIKSIKEDFFDEDDFDESNVIRMAYVKNENVLASDEFWIMLKDRDYDLVILDDLDYFLSPREQNVSSELEVRKDKFISELLSFTDGIIKNKTKFLISTNRDIDAIDEALQRAGRLFAVFSFEELTSEQALVIWEKSKLKKKDFFKEFKGDFVLQAELGSKINEYIKNNNKAAKPFLKKGSKIDISNKFKRRRKAGFDV